MATFDPEKLSPREVYGLLTDVIVPRPIAWVSTIDGQGRTNLAPYSFFNGICIHPALVMVACARRPDGSEKDTARNARETGEMVIHIVTAELAEAMNQSSAEHPPGVSEIDAGGLATVASERVRPPRLADARVALECRLVEVLHPGGRPVDMLIGEIVLVHARDDIARHDPPGIDPHRLDAVGRLGGIAYTHVREIFEMERPPRPEPRA